MVEVDEVLTSDGESFKVETIGDAGNTFNYGYYQSETNYVSVSYDIDGQYTATGTPVAGTAMSLLADFAISSAFFSLKEGTDNVYEFINPGIVDYMDIFYNEENAKTVSLSVAESLTITLEDDGDVVVSFDGGNAYGDYDITITYSSIGEVESVFPNGVITA